MAGIFVLSSNSFRQNVKSNGTLSVEKYAALGDYDKLCAYLTEICDLTKYNIDAAKGGSTAVGVGHMWNIK